jgi:hypothetical protein
MNFAQTARPLAVTVLTVFAAVAGVLAALDTLRFLNILPIVVFGPLRFFDFNLFGAILSGLVTVIWFSTVGQLWRLDPRGWMFVVVVAAMNLIFLLIAWLGRSSFSAVLPGMIANGAALAIAFLPDTKRAFGRG